MLPILAALLLVLAPTLEGFVPVVTTNHQPTHRQATPLVSLAATPNNNQQQQPKSRSRRPPSTSSSASSSLSPLRPRSGSRPQAPPTNNWYQRRKSGTAPTTSRTKKPPQWEKEGDDLYKEIVVRGDKDDEQEKMTYDLSLIHI